MSNMSNEQSPRKLSDIIRSEQQDVLSISAEMENGRKLIRTLVESGTVGLMQKLKEHMSGGYLRNSCILNTNKSISRNGSIENDISGNFTLYGKEDGYGNDLGIDPNKHILPVAASMIRYNYSSESYPAFSPMLGRVEPAGTITSYSILQAECVEENTIILKRKFYYAWSRRREIEYDDSRFVKDAIKYKEKIDEILGEFYKKQPSKSIK
jgi:hypothetical protein